MSDEATTTGENEAPEQNASTPDFSEQFADLSAKFDKLIEAQQPAPSSPVDALAGDPIDYDYEPEPEEEPEYVEEGVDGELADRLSNVETYLSEREQEQRRSALDALAEKYKGFSDEENLRAISAVIRPIAERTGDMSLLTDPVLVEHVHKSLAAEADAAAETPAEEAGSRGAVLETGASAGAPTESHPDDKFIENFGKATQGNAFV